MAGNIGPNGFAAGLLRATRRCLVRYAGFSGRASRREFWSFALVCALGLAASAVVDSILSAGTAAIGPVTVIFALVVAVPHVASGWRRMHDTGRSGLFLVYPLIVLAGIGSFANFMGMTVSALSGDAAAMADTFGETILGLAVVVLALSPLLVLWWLTRPGHRGPNRYGPPADF